MNAVFSHRHSTPDQIKAAAAKARASGDTSKARQIEAIQERRQTAIAAIWRK